MLHSTRTVLFSLPILLIAGLFSLPASAQTLSSVVDTRLDAATLERGYTVTNESGTAKIGVVGGRVLGVDSTRVRVRTVAKPEKFPVQPELAAHADQVGDIFRMRLGKGAARRISLAGPLWFSLSFPTNLPSNRVEMRYWDTKTDTWQLMEQKVQSEVYQIHAQRKKKNIVVSVFLRKEVPLDSIEHSGIASYYFNHSGRAEAASNDYPMGTVIRVTNESTGAYVDATVVSTGPFVEGRIVDLNAFAFEQIAGLGEGLASVSVVRVQ